MSRDSADAGASGGEEQADLAALIVAQAVEAVIYADTDGRVRLWNAAAGKLFGFVVQEALGASLELIIPITT